jgi:hypothetical protein
LSTIHGRHVCKDREQTISILAIQSKKAACERFSKQLLDIGDGKVTTDETGCIKLPTNLQHLLPGDLVSYKSIDTVCDAIEAVNYPTDFLNSLDLLGMPPYNLQLKVESPVILLRNLNPSRLCNGT